MNNIIALILTLIIGLFMLIGSLIIFLTDDNDHIINFAISMAFSIMIFLLGVDLIPEAYSLIGNSNLIESTTILIILALIGISMLKILDHYIPHHHDDHCDDGHHHDEEMEESHLFHIGLVSTIAIALHNIIEGMAVYGTIISSLQTGFLICIGISLHNIPLGMAITSTLYKANHSVKKTLFYIFLLSISPFLGGLIMWPLGLTAYGNLILTILMGITIGMLIYIIIFELLPTVIETKHLKTTFLGILTGIIIMVISTLI